MIRMEMPCWFSPRLLCRSQGGTLFYKSAAPGPSAPAKGCAGRAKRPFTNDRFQTTV